jgi:hypothetical protein
LNGLPAGSQTLVGRIGTQRAGPPRLAPLT